MCPLPGDLFKSGVTLGHPSQPLRVKFGLIHQMFNVRERGQSASILDLNSGLFGWTLGCASCVG